MARPRQRLLERRGLLDGATDDRIDDLGELCRMRGGQKNPPVPPLLPILPIPPIPPIPPLLPRERIRFE
jgi:hypothetical protein